MGLAASTPGLLVGLYSCPNRPCEERREHGFPVVGLAAQNWRISPAVERPGAGSCVLERDKHLQLVDYSDFCRGAHISQSGSHAACCRFRCGVRSRGEFVFAGPDQGKDRTRFPFGPTLGTGGAQALVPNTLLGVEHLLLSTDRPANVRNQQWDSIRTVRVCGLADHAGVRGAMERISALFW